MEMCTFSDVHDPKAITVWSEPEEGFDVREIIKIVADAIDRCSIEVIREYMKIRECYVRFRTMLEEARVIIQLLGTEKKLQQWSGDPAASIKFTECKLVINGDCVTDARLIEFASALVYWK